MVYWGFFPPSLAGLEEYHNQPIWFIYRIWDGVVKRRKHERNLNALSLAKFAAYLSVVITSVLSSLGGKKTGTKESQDLKSFLPHPEMILDEKTVITTKTKTKRNKITDETIALFWEMRANKEFSPYIDRALARDVVLLNYFKKKKPGE